MCAGSIGVLGQAMDFNGRLVVKMFQAVFRIILIGMPPDMPLQKPLPNPPMFKTAPLVMYSQAKSPTPSTTAIAPEFLTAKRSPASPLIKALPPVAPNRAKLPINTLLPGVLRPPPGIQQQWCLRTRIYQRHRYRCQDAPCVCRHSGMLHSFVRQNRVYG